MKSPKSKTRWHRILSGLLRELLVPKGIMVYTDIMEEQITDLPFKLDVTKILIIKQVPALICESCGEIMLSDTVMEECDKIIDKINSINSEITVLPFAA
ncbi:MAG: YgiT-type zinc finger protein [Desulfococcaceae bacterium]|jgi:YgiT-type zinc finger domain-containing protein|nr:YgiT-type zinc finger protein [Desulfococcaceae bacterium]